MFSCGTNFYGQLGRNSDLNLCLSLQKIESLSGIVRVECGSAHTMCIDINNDFFVFGNNETGQLGSGNRSTALCPIKHPSLSNIIDISRGGSKTFVKTVNNQIFAYGDNKYSQLGIVTKKQHQLIPIRVFENNEDIWCSNVPISKAKSARK